ncbi:hypothetical protein [Paludibacterium yongneupense]|uniref:hypothetical protein n=1 Tax=Paludibacterium yongneupense TaxID=400061 RepID=UPI00041BB911|nr:hypothetical protein [Paludibacterium yongneupense]
MWGTHLGQSEQPPAHLLLGKDAISRVKEKLALLDEEIAAREAVSLSTDFE